MLQVNIIKGRIIERFGSLSKFADAVNWSSTKISRMMSGKQEPSVKDVKDMAVALEITNPVDVVALFLFN